MAAKKFENVQAKQVMNRVKAPGMPFAWSINPYRGCAHGCSFCYARATHTFLGMEADDAFQNHILLKVNAPEALDDQLRRALRRCGGDPDALARQVGLVAIGTATDPYQPVEAKARLTRECLKVLAKYGIPVTLTTRSPLILRDRDILRELPVASVNISINTLKIDVWRNLEPASPHPRQRLEAVRRLAEEGLHAGIFLAPIVPFLTDGTQDLDALLAAAKRCGARFAMPSVMRLGPEAKAWYRQTVDKHYPHLQGKYERLYGNGAYPARFYVDTLMRRVNALLKKHGFSAKQPQRDDWRKTWPEKERQQKQMARQDSVQLSFSF
ncbi:Rv2578c family radical SAM protein [Bacillaceae bacterium]